MIVECPCKAERICIQCGASSPCGLLPPEAEEGDEPICQFEPETYDELVARVKAAYGEMARMRARLRELEREA